MSQIHHKQDVLVILGPTASGKTAYAIEEARKRGGHIISADSRQLYVHMNIGTAKPQEAWSSQTHDVYTPDVVEGIPHYLFNIQYPNQHYTLSRWQSTAYEVIERMQHEHAFPIVVGGTMLYLDSILFHYTIPNIAPDPEYRNTLESQSVETLWDQLIQQDPHAKDFIQPRNTRRIIRALEVMNATGKPFSEQRRMREPLYSFQCTGLFPGWHTLTKNITQRAHAMFDAGLVHEVERLRSLYGLTIPLLRTMGYKQAGMYIDGTLTLQEAIDETIRATYLYARRQMRWWKGRQDISWM